MSHTVFGAAMLLAGILLGALPRPAHAEGTFIAAPERTDMVYDRSRDTLYIANGTAILRYRVGTGEYLAPFILGDGSAKLLGIDLSPNGRYLVVTDGRVSQGYNWVYVVDPVTGEDHQQRFALARGESGTYAVAFGRDGGCLVTSQFAGSGWVPLRRLYPSNGAASILLDRICQSTSLATSGDGSVIGFAEANLSSGPFGCYRVSDRSIRRAERHVDTRFNYAIGVNSNGTQYALIASGKAYIHDANLAQIGVLRASPGHYPVGVVYHPVEDILYCSWSSSNLVIAYDAGTLDMVGGYDIENQDNHAGFGGAGRLRISPDGSLLFATVEGGVRCVRLGESLYAANQTVATPEDRPVPVTLTADVGTGGTLYYSVVGSPAHGRLSGLAPNLTYRPDPDYVGTDRFTFQATYGQATSNLATVSITVTAVNDAPRFEAGPDVVVEENCGPYTRPAWAAGVAAGPPNESGQTLHFVVTNTKRALFAAQPALSDTGTLTFTPASDVCGTATVTVRLFDDGGRQNGGSDMGPVRQFTITVLPATGATPAADLLIKKADQPDTAFALGGFYQETPAGEQVETTSVLPGASARYVVRLRNASASAARHVLRARENAPAGWSAVYRAAGVDISARVRQDDGFVTDAIPAGGAVDVIVDESAPASALAGSRMSVVLQAFAEGSAAGPSDAVQAITTASVVARPDLLIKSAYQVGSNYGLDNVYQETPAGRQIEVQGVAPGQMATYTVRIQNDGNVTRTFTLRAEREGASGWVSDYMVDGKRIAAAVEGPDGYTTRGMAPGATLDVTVMLAPTTMAVGGSTAGITLKAFLHRNDVVVRDAVQAVATVPVLRRGDLMLKSGTNPDSAYSGDSIYQSMPSGIQVLRQIVRPGGRVSFTVKMENDGNMAMPFVVSAQGSSGGGWTVSYRRGSLDVSTLILGQTGYTTETLAVGTSVLFTIEMTRGWNALPTSGRTATLRVGQWAGWPMDTVSAVASALGTTGPDLLLKAGGGDEGKFAVDDVYQGTPFASQIVSQSVAAGGTATYQAMVQNDAVSTRSFTVRAVESGRPGWRTTYRVGSRNITGRLTSQEGYATPAIAAGGHLIVVVAVTPPAGAAAGSQRTTCLRVFTTGEDTAPQDAVRATTRAVAAARKRY